MPRGDNPHPSLMEMTCIYTPLSHGDNPHPSPVGTTHTPLHKKYHEPKECHVGTLRFPTPLSIEKGQYTMGHMPKSHSQRASLPHCVGVSNGCVKPFTCERPLPLERTRKKPPLEFVSPLFFRPEVKHSNDFIVGLRRIFALNL